MSRGGRLPAQAGNGIRMFYVYVLRSLVRNWVYIGMTQRLNNRLNEHNKGLVKSTKAYLPFELLFVQQVPNRGIARDLEKYLKVRWNKESLLEILM